MAFLGTVEQTASPQRSANEEDSESTRHAKMTYWREFSKEASVKEMLLDFDAEELSKEEIPEIMSMVPDTAGMDVLELAAGIGRFTGLFGEHSKTVKAVDFIETFVDKNRELNGYMTNCQFVQADVTKLQEPTNSYDLVFSSWLLQYLDDVEVEKLLVSLLRWIRPGGFFFFRESCYYTSGNIPRACDPTKYREPSFYHQLLQRVSIATDDADGQYVFEVIMCKPLQTYIKRKSNRNQLCWLVHKVRVTDASDKRGCRSIQQFLDSFQYSERNIRNLEMMYGKNFCCPGGREGIEEVLKKLSLEPGKEILDVGCGLGGAAFFMAQKYGARVTAMDLSSNMIALALERALEFKDITVDFEVGDATKREFPSKSFDAVFSSDAILHIRDKRKLFSSFYRWLRPGGQLLITDFCCGTNAKWSTAFADHVAWRGYQLLPVDQYAQILRDVGFATVESEDRTDQFVRCLTRELNFVEANKQNFVSEMSTDEYNGLVELWQDKLANCATGDHRWGMFYARK